MHSQFTAISKSVDVRMLEKVLFTRWRRC